MELIVLSTKYRYCDFFVLFLFVCLFLSEPCRLQDLSSPVRDETHALGSESTESQPLDWQGNPQVL